MTGLRVAYAGTPEFAVAGMEALLTSRHRLQLVITQPDRPAGRGRQLTASPVKSVAKKHKLQVLQPQNVNTPEFLAQLSEHSLDLLVVAAFGQLFSAELLALPKYGCINIHASLLPRWRGASPIQHAILAGDKNSGVTIMQMARRMDAGDIWLQSECAIRSNDTAQSLHDTLAAMSGSALVEAIDAIMAGTVCPRPQDDKQATYCTKLRKSDGSINWHEDAAVIARKIRAYYPWPGAFSDLNGRRLVIIDALEEHTNAAMPGPGTVMQADNQGILVATAKNAIRIRELIPAGGKRIRAADFANSNHILQAVLGGAE